MSIPVTLPSINGEIEAGITSGVDASLPDERKLPIVYVGKQPGVKEAIKTYALAWAFPLMQDVEARKLFLNGISVLIDVGLIRMVGDIPDGDWKRFTVTSTPGQAPLVTPEQCAELAKSISVEEMIRAVTVIIATKANWWLMNHHTGQGVVSGYVKKVLDVFYKDRVTDQLVTAAYQLGHFTSTLGVLTLAGIANVRQSVAVCQGETASLNLSADAKLRFTSMPSGTHRCGIAYEAAKRLVRSVYAQYCPSVEDFMVIPGIKADIMAAPARYHMGASYLTGMARAEYSDMDMEHYLGRLGTFINTLYKNSTLAKSPHLSTSRVESYEDYDADFKSTLIRIQQAQAQARGRIVEEGLAAGPTIGVEMMQRVRDAFKPAVHPN